MARSLRTARSASPRSQTVRAARTGGPGSDTSDIDAFPGHRLGPRTGRWSTDQVIPSAGECSSMPVIKGQFGDLMKWSGDKVTRCLCASKRSRAHQSARLRTRTPNHGIW
jgi:hypothetical protein